MPADALDHLWEELTARLEKLDVPVFPAVPDTDCLSVADWPGTDWAAFVDLAIRVGAPVMYAQPHRIAESQLTALTEAADALEAAAAAALDDADGADGVVDEPDVLLGAEARAQRWRSVASAARVGAVAHIEVGFVVGGVLHLWSDETEEHSELVAAGEEAAETIAQLEESAADREAAAIRAARGSAGHGELWVSREAERLLRGLKPRIEEWAQQLVASEVFIGGSSQQVRWRLAAEVIPELGEWRELPDRRENPQSRARHWASGEACSRAEEVLPAVRDQRLSALRDRAQEVAGRVASDPDFAARRTKQVRRQYVRDLVTAELGFGSAELTDLLLELADEERSR